MDGSDDSIPSSEADTTTSSAPSLPRAEPHSTKEYYSNFNSVDNSRDGSREDALGISSPSAPGRPRKASESRTRPALALLFEATRKRNSYVASMNSRASADGIELELSNDDLGPLPSSLYSRSNSVDGAPRSFPLPTIPPTAFDKLLDSNASSDRNVHSTTSSRSLARDGHTSTHTTSSRSLARDVSGSFAQSLDDTSPTTSRSASVHQRSGSGDAISLPIRRLSFPNAGSSSLSAPQNNVRVRPQLVSEATLTKGANEPEPQPQTTSATRTASVNSTKESSKLTESSQTSPTNTLPKTPARQLPQHILKTAAAEDIPSPPPNPAVTVAPTPQAVPPTSAAALTLKPSDTRRKPQAASSSSLPEKPKSRNVLVVPLIFGWTEYFLHSGWVAFYAMVDVIMLVDCFLQARVSFNNKYGSLVRDNRAMFYNFAVTNRGWWIILTSLPVDFCIELSSPVFTGMPTVLIPFLDIMPDGGNNYDVLQLYWRYKIWAAVRFFKVLARLPYRRLYDAKISGVAAPVSRLTKTLVILMWMGHLDACMFWFLDTFLPYGARWIDTQNLLFYAGTTNVVPFSTQYLISYLSAVRSLVLRLREVELDPENIYVLVEFVGGILAYGTVFGNLHSIVEMLDSTAAVTHAEEQHKFEMGWLRTYMRDKGLVPELQKMVSAHKELQWRKSQGTDEAHLFDDIPKSVQQEIKNFLYLDLVRKVPLFVGADAAFHNSITFKIKPLHVLDKWFVFQKGDDGSEMYFVKTGSVEIVGPEGQIFVTLGPGSFFGEIALFEGKEAFLVMIVVECKRTASARAKGSIELCVLTKDDFNGILRQYSVVAERIKTTIAERKANEARLKALEAEKQAAEAKRKAEEAEAESARKALQEAERRANASSSGFKSRALLQGMTKKNLLGSQQLASNNGVSKSILPFGVSRAALPSDPEPQPRNVNGSSNYLRLTINRAPLTRDSFVPSNSSAVPSRQISVVSVFRPEHNHGATSPPRNAEHAVASNTTSNSTSSDSMNQMPAVIARTLSNALRGLADMISDPHLASNRASVNPSPSASANGSMNGLPMMTPPRSHSASDVVPMYTHALQHTQLSRDGNTSARSHMPPISRLRESIVPTMGSGSSVHSIPSNPPSPSMPRASARTDSSLLRRNLSSHSRNPSGLSIHTPPTDSVNALTIAPGMTRTFTADIIAATSRCPSLVPPNSSPYLDKSVGDLPIINLRAPSTVDSDPGLPTFISDQLSPIDSSHSLSSRPNRNRALSRGSSRGSVSSVKSTLDPSVIRGPRRRSITD
ncbi:hypothetical protein SmJEL517_g02118 [Synchytrium microbalum]|uniref:Cyclic nucleotide-binding domain-containing protein n=1 Tax=Synchytrium microbalum TaxID=1806994 RepID=A0A507C7D3_9FUNG|nr:uncharacterized protein SmJEL517_g02118 [Synchytrium microbalum]TPX35512.1 hypothetical protein SmJEL517_g02118 [Synchytrium microbalum]